ncbi:PilN domain-containing protein [Chloroflexota bacterium]
MKVDINLLPPEHRPKPWALPLTVGLIIVVLAAGYYGFGLYGKSASAQSELEQMQSQLESTNAEIETVLSDQTLQEYQDRIAETQVEIDGLQAMQHDYETRNAERIYWKPVLQTIRELAPSDITLTAFEQNGDEITVEGELSNEVDNAIVVVEYAQLLENRGIFSRIAFEIGTEMAPAGEDEEPEEIFIFTMLLEVKPGG